MVGSGTAVADDPDLTVRDLGARHQPVRIVLDRQLRHAPESRLGRTAGASPVWLVHGPVASEARRAAWTATGANLIEVPETTDGLDLAAALSALAQRGITRVLSEGGGSIAASLVAARLADELALFSGGLLIGADGRPALGNLGLDLLAEAPRPVLRDTEVLGPDLYSLWSLT
jgi:diaminohydroxyphosphoribosylaminopyrimidine deaminase/5-amino-6-(5-phosphoribosylamino)uracil reductase